MINYEQILNMADEKIDIEKDNQSSEIRIYNIFGQFVKNIKATDISQLSNILPSGVYIINGKKYYIK